MSIPGTWPVNGLPTASSCATHASELHVAGTRELLSVVDGEVVVSAAGDEAVLRAGDGVSCPATPAMPTVTTATWPRARADRVRARCVRVAAMTSERVEATLAQAFVEPAVVELRPEYAVVLVAVDGLPGGPSDEKSDAWLRKADAAAACTSPTGPRGPAARGALRDAYRAFGAKPQRTRNSLEALLRRVSDGLPRINRLTDLYNAVSVLHEIPVGGTWARRGSSARRVRSRSSRSQGRGSRGVCRARRGGLG